MICRLNIAIEGQAELANLGATSSSTITFRGRSQLHGADFAKLTLENMPLETVLFFYFNFMLSIIKRTLL
jgi:hypothetical protein